MKRAVLTSVFSALALTSLTITAAAVTLTNSSPRTESAAAAAPATTTTEAGDEVSLAPPVEVEDVPVGVADVALVSANGAALDEIPNEAVAAYQRAAAVLGQADRRCHLDWTLLAAVGQVVTEHGSIAGSRLDQRGVMRPRLTGKPLTGAQGKRIPDSDAGRLDGDPRFDRPIGPMQLAPTTWAVVGVDSDGDGRRNPNDIDDASLAVGVLLCSGDGDLRKRAGRVDAVSRVNDNRSFIATVLAVDRAYRTQMSEWLDADPVLVPGDPPSYLPTDLPTDVPTDVVARALTEPTARHSDGPSARPTNPVTWWPSPTLPSPTPQPTRPTGTPDACPTDEPTDEPSDLPTDTATAEPSDVPTGTVSAEPTETPTDELSDTPTDDPTEDPCGDATD